MQWQRVTAIVRRDALESVEQRLQQLRAPGLSVTTVKGYGEYANFFRHDWFITHVRIEIFTDADHACAIAEAILSAAHTGTQGGLVAILPVADGLPHSGAAAVYARRALSTVSPADRAAQ